MLIEVIVIGDGVAGIAAALYCLQQGLNTILVRGKRRKANEDNVESIHPGVISLLTHLKIGSDFQQAILGSYSFIGNERMGKSLNPFTDEIWNGLHISKRRFVDHLIDEAKLQQLSMLEQTVENVIFEQGRIVGVKTKSGNEIFSKYVIDASGSKRIVGKKLGLHERYYSPPLVVCTGVSLASDCAFSEPQYAYFLPNSNGWTWIAQLENKSFYWTKLSSKMNVEFSVPTELSKASGTKINKVANMRWRIFRPLCIEGGILCGDAASLIDPAAGQGILNALTSGIRAGQTATECIRNTKFEKFILAEYDSSSFNQFEFKANQLREHYETEGINVLNESTQQAGRLF